MRHKSRTSTTSGSDARPSVPCRPAEPVAEVVRESLLDEPIFTVDVSDHPASAPFPICFSSDCRTSPIT
jgi:hypothetical protein